MDANPNVRRTGGPSVPKPPTYAGPAKQVLHLFLSAAGWVIFIYWWSLVLRTVSRQTVLITGLFLLIALVVVVGVTALWSWHNKRLYDHKGPRTRVRDVPEDYGLDYVGRMVTFVGSRERMQDAAEVDVSFDDDAKTYRAVASDDTGGAAARGGTAGTLRSGDRL